MMKNYVSVTLFTLVLISLSGCNTQTATDELADLKLCRFAANFFGSNQEIDVLDQKLSDYWDKFRDVRDADQIKKINDIELDVDTQIESIREQIVVKKDGAAKDELEQRYRSTACTALTGSRK